ncbi:hypothetical protein BRADI_1g29669v3 [Brachypodium distachyon]|uniref:R13L1/DRL21-like LRR repeat region domain-containing protein n=1 Tax=Brachypodium distachyon TaxID=15368 RepID=A0A0Q3H202_BRADI|nr:hypothetical protein BRADI_1g29669v3 [Brachypodium distachyon]
MEDRYEETFRREMVKLRSKIDIVNLRALMVFRAYGENIDEILKETFKEIEGLRVLLVEVESVESLPNNFSKLIHLRYLKIRTPKYDPEVALPSTLSRFYHLILLDLSSWHPSTKLPKDISRLINLRHFVAGQELHSNVPAVGKMKCLKELTEFCVKKESDGFELSELGALTELGGKLRICNLENVATKEEALKAKLVSKGGLKKLTLVWGGDQQVAKSDVLDGLEPHRNLQALCIENHGGSTGPSWFCGSNISTKMLASLHLEGVSWVDPPFGHLLHLTSLTLKKISGLCQIRPGFGGVTDRSFMKLKKIGLHSLPGFTEWVGSPDAQTFSGLEEIRCSSCPKLCSLPFLQEPSAVTCNHLTSLEISKCPMLFLPPMPHTSTLTEVDVKDSPVGRMAYNGIFKSLSFNGYIREVAWHNMAGKLESVRFGGGSAIPWTELPKLTSLREFQIEEDPSFLSTALLSNLPTSLTSLWLPDCENLTVDGFNPLIAAVNLKELVVCNTRKDSPRSVAADLLSELAVASNTKLLLPAAGCFQLETLNVDCISAMLAAPVCSLFSTTLHKLFFSSDQRVESFTEEEENALQLLTSLQSLCFWKCRCLPALPQGLHSLSSLTELQVVGCPEIRSLPKGGLPTSLRELCVINCSPEPQEQGKELRGTKPDLYVYCYT